VSTVDNLWDVSDFKGLVYFVRVVLRIAIRGVLGLDPPLLPSPAPEGRCLACGALRLGTGADASGGSIWEWASAGSVRGRAMAAGKARKGRGSEIEGALAVRGPFPSGALEGVVAVRHGHPIACIALEDAPPRREDAVPVQASCTGCKAPDGQFSQTIISPALPPISASNWRKLASSIRGPCSR
jgi:hypothetical protein